MSRNIHENVSNIKDLDSVIEWFVNSLKIIFPDTPYKQGVLLKAVDDNDLKRGFGALLRYFNTGIDGVKLIEVQFENLEFHKIYNARLKQTYRNPIQMRHLEHYVLMIIYI